MNVLRWGANMVENTTPAGLILAGAVLAVASPPVRRSLRSAAVMATRGVLMAAGTVQGAMATMREGMEDIAAEAKGPVEPTVSTAAPRRGRIIRTARNRGRRLAVSAAAGAVAVRDELRDIVKEAKQHQDALPADHEPASSAAVAGQQESHDHAEHELSGLRIEPDGLEASPTEIGPDSSSKRRPRAKQQ